VLLFCMWMVGGRCLQFAAKLSGYICGYGMRYTAPFGRAYLPQDTGPRGLNSHSVVHSNTPRASLSSFFPLVSKHFVAFAPFTSGVLRGVSRAPWVNTPSSGIPACVSTRGRAVLCAGWSVSCAQHSAYRFPTNSLS